MFFVTVWNNLPPLPPPPPPPPPPPKKKKKKTHKKTTTTKKQKNMNEGIEGLNLLGKLALNILKYKKINKKEI